MGPLAANPLIEVVPGLMIWTLICFGITFFVLRKWIFGPVQKAIDARRERIRQAQRERMKEELEAERQRRLEDTTKQIEAETRRALEQIRSEVAELTVIATSKVTGKVLTDDDHRRLIDDAISELDFSVLEEVR
jgi:F-type H+-transporting ATPase subunit b